MKLRDFTAESKTPFIEFVSKNIAIADGQEADDWQAYEELAISSVRSVMEWFEEKK